MRALSFCIVLLTPGCAAFKLTPAQAALDAGKVLLAAAVGFATGGPAGAIIGAAGAESQNIVRIEKTLGKNPIKVSPKRS